MRILVVGAGAVGGYFGGRMALAGQDVTFLVREGRANELAENGLVIKGPRGEVKLSSVKTVLTSQIDAPYDLILLSCKAYDLDGAMDAFAPAVGASTTILPLLNGMRHLDRLGERFGRASVLGGVCLIAATLDATRAIVQMTDMHAIVFGEPDGARSARRCDCSGFAHRRVRCRCNRCDRAANVGEVGLPCDAGRSHVPVPFEYRQYPQRPRWRGSVACLVRRVRRGGRVPRPCHARTLRRTFTRDAVRAGLRVDGVDAA